MEIHLGKLMFFMLVDISRHAFAIELFLHRLDYSFLCLVSLTTRWRRSSVCSGKKTRGTDASASTGGGAEHGLDPAATADPDRVPSAVDRRFLLASVGLAVRHRNAGLLDRRYRSDLAVVRRNVDRITDREVAASPSAGILTVLKKYFA